MTPPPFGTFPKNHPFWMCKASLGGPRGPKNNRKFFALDTKLDPQNCSPTPSHCLPRHFDRSLPPKQRSFCPHFHNHIPNAIQCVPKANTNNDLGVGSNNRFCWKAPPHIHDTTWEKIQWKLLEVQLPQNQPCASIGQFYIFDLPKIMKCSVLWALNYKSHTLDTSDSSWSKIPC